MSRRVSGLQVVWDDRSHTNAVNSCGLAMSDNPFEVGLVCVFSDAVLAGAEGLDVEADVTLSVEGGIWATWVT